MPRTSTHPGRDSQSAPFDTVAIAAASAAAEHALPETCKIGGLTLARDPDPPYGTTATFAATATGVPCLIEPGDDRQAVIGEDPSTILRFDVQMPAGTTIAVDQTIEVTAGPNVGLRLHVEEIPDSSTEPLLRVLCRRVTAGEG